MVIHDIKNSLPLNPTRGLPRHRRVHLKGLKFKHCLIRLLRSACLETSQDGAAFTWCNVQWKVVKGEQ